jgi:endonuclease/exonuclease/phosphatase (EEP) superfamily protein YafD
MKNHRQAILLFALLLLQLLTKGKSENHRKMRIIVQNLQKQPSLATDLVKQFQPDMMLLQEINLYSEDNQPSFSAHFVSDKRGFGTAICSNTTIPTNVRHVPSPHAELGGFIYKKTVVADCMGLQLVSFHGYNGQPSKNVQKLVDHVAAVLAVVDSTTTAMPTIFAGDFNTWTQRHLDAITTKLEEAGFYLAFSWPYPGREQLTALDHVFLRGDSIQLVNTRVFSSKSDHQGVLLELLLQGEEVPAV